MSHYNLAIIISAIYNLCIIAGCTWMVAVENWSGWWYLLAIGLMTSVKDTGNTEKT
jgi:hypothetical protein